MRIIEIILKLAFLAVSAYMTFGGLSHESFSAFLLVSVLLGFTLIFNQKHPSYAYPAGYQYASRVTLMRRIEGILILAFACAAAYVAFA